MNTILLIIAWSMAFLITANAALLVMRDRQITQGERRLSVALLGIGSLCICGIILMLV